MNTPLLDMRMQREMKKLTEINLPYFEDVSTYEKFFGQHNLKIWKVFFDYINKPSYRILDFGCGSGWSIYLGRTLGYRMYGLDTLKWSKAMRFVEFRRALGVSRFTKLYSGAGTLPFKDDYFDVIVCRASFNKFNNSDGRTDREGIILERIKEFSRIATGPRMLVFAGGYFKNYREEFFENDLTNIHLWHRNVKISQIWKGKK